MDQRITFQLCTIGNPLIVNLPTIIVLLLLLDMRLSLKDPLFQHHIYKEKTSFTECWNPLRLHFSPNPTRDKFSFHWTFCGVKLFYLNIKKPDAFIIAKLLYTHGIKQKYNPIIRSPHIIIIKIVSKDLFILLIILTKHLTEKNNELVGCKW